MPGCLSLFYENNTRWLFPRWKHHMVTFFTVKMSPNPQICYFFNDVTFTTQHDLDPGTGCLALFGWSVSLPAAAFPYGIVVRETSEQEKPTHLRQRHKTFIQLVYIMAQGTLLLNFCQFRKTRWPPQSIPWISFFAQWHHWKCTYHHQIWRAHIRKYSMPGLHILER